MSLQECLQPLFSNDVSLGCTEAKGYGNFAVKFLHVSVTKLKSLTDITSVCELVRAVERCCACYLRVQNELTFDDEFYVPKLVFHVLNSVRHKVRDHLKLSRSIPVFPLTFQTGGFYTPYV